ncbi:Multicopper oxidase with three cupredoxin domains [Geosmithia morbida]|uniref:Multicopper oxidase with three cupredoxin domains n=1 Tax=Geosmithia morbida TaxID=1094350 RepID=A0A9P4YQW4_9HYPO|nr:Multicopper oxidase with three cupredoxin domains [Geosmithia morbida]KAF4120043.1 Multicopper oxidase with three cupredoxin domains [Geosmithia morbida]
MVSAAWLPVLGSVLNIFLTGVSAAAFSHPPQLPAQPRTFDLFVTWGNVAPDGFSREAFLVNGQSPGPVLEIDQDDSVLVRVHNESPYNVTTHFHGIEMLGTPWSDGVPGVTQRPIEPSKSFEYRFEATQYGSYWYHSHFRSQIEDGLYGPIVIHPRADDPKPFRKITKDRKTLRKLVQAERNVYPLAISDFSHYNETYKGVVTSASRIEVSCYDSVVFNGHGSVNCLDPEEVKAHLTPDQQAFLALVPGSEMTDKSCLPIEVMGAIGDLGGGEKAKPAEMASEIFAGCTPTEGSVETIYSESGEWIAIDVIGSVNFITGVLSIDEHDIWVYAMDGSYIEPQKVQALSVTNGDRFSILVHTPRPGDFKLRFNAITAPQMIVGNAILSVVEGGGWGRGAGNSSSSDSDVTSQPYIDIVGVALSDDVVFFNQTIARPFPAEPIAQEADQTFILHMKTDGASYLWAMNSTRFMPDDIEDANALPTLFNPQPGLSDNVTISTKNGTWVDLVFLADYSPMPSHPIHKHSNKMFQIGSGNGAFNWTSVNEAVKERPDLFNLVDPPRRDTFISPPAVTTLAWTAVRYHVVNPGAFLLHCHIDNHLVGGMMVVIQDGVDAWPEIPMEYQALV